MTSQFAIRLAAHHIRNSGIIIYPTETVYGLGCDPDNVDAVTRLKELKQRNHSSGFLILASSIEQLDRFIQKPDANKLKLINDTTEATSWITKAHKQTPSWLVSPDGTIGFRITQHPVTKNLCHLLDHPIISTSANFKGRKPASNTLQCHQMFSEEVDYILTSSFSRSEEPSAIRDLNNGTRLR